MAVGRLYCSLIMRRSVSQQWGPCQPGLESLSDLKQEKTTTRRCTVLMLIMGREGGLRAVWAYLPSSNATYICPVSNRRMVVIGAIWQLTASAGRSTMPTWPDWTNAALDFCHYYKTDYKWLTLTWIMI